MLTRSHSVHEDVMIPIEIIIKFVFPFLPLRELFRFSHTNSELKNAVTYDMALKAVMTHSRYSLESMIILKTLIDRRSIYPVSVDRIMRIGLGKLCEVCLKNKVQHARVAYGNFVCWRCTKRCSDRLSKRENSFFNMNQEVCTMVLGSLPMLYPLCYGERPLNRRDDPAAHRQLTLARSYGIGIRSVNTPPRHFMCLIGDLFTYMWKHEQFNNFGTRIGPIVTYHLAVVQGMEQLVQSGVQDSFSIQAHMSNLLDQVNVPSKDNPLYSVFIEAFDDHIEYAKEVWYRRKSEREMRQEIYANKRVSVAIKLISSLKLVTDDPTHNELLDYHVNQHFFDVHLRRLHKERPLKMNVKWVNNFLNDALACPSRVRGKALKELGSKFAYKAKEDMSEEDNERLLVKRHVMRRSNREGLLSYRFIEYAYTKQYSRLKSRQVHQRQDTLSVRPYRRRYGQL